MHTGVMATILTVFRSRLREDARADYEPEAQRIDALARTMPGFLGIKTFVADDGERVSIVEFDSQEHHDYWRDHPEHRVAQRRGRDEFYETYTIQVCEVRRERRFSRPD